MPGAAPSPPGPVPGFPSPGTADPADPMAWLAALAAGSGGNDGRHGRWGEPGDRLRHVRQIPERIAETAPLPPWVTPTLAGALQAGGLAALWSHQAQTADLAHAGEHVVVSTGTASGKSLGFLLPVLSDLIDGAAAPTGRGATGLYLAPTKALARDQLDRINRLALPGLRAAAYDGDAEPQERRWVREHAAYVLTNPDLLHHTLLPGHQHWAPFLRALRYVVVDECHVYRGVFGAHVALVLRRLRRVAARYRSTPTFVLASATVADPAAHAQRLIGMPVRPVTRDGSPRAAVTIGLWEPAARPSAAAEPGVGHPRRSAVAEAADLLADLVGQGVQTVAFARSRVGVETVAAAARRRLADRGWPRGAIAAYRGGYLPEERRALEQQLRSGQLRGLAATNALELGIDVSGLDAVVLAGWPGTVSSFWQQVGRGGRAGRESLAVLVAADDPLDSYLVAHPEAIFDRPVEASVIDPTNPHIVGPHLACAAAELPITPAELDGELFGPEARGLLDDLVATGVLRRRPAGWYWAHPQRATELVSLRGIGRTVQIVERSSGRVVGHVDDARADAVVHEGSVHVHQGQSFVVTEFDRDQGCALVVAGDPGWSTQARSVSTFRLGRVLAERIAGPLKVAFGQVTVDQQVVSFLRRLPDGEVIGEHPLDSPVRTLTTTGVWWTLPEAELATAGVGAADLPGALHAAEHAAIGMLPLIATADRWDIGGVSTALHPDTGLPTVLVYDGVAGGAGFAQRGYAAIADWLGATRDVIAGCGCVAGCPSCVHSPKCGNGNSPLDKAGAVAVLGLMLGLLGPLGCDAPM
ncbi:MAG: DEAD/DEAH box helicase [Candidatus Phosphoribacter sp.]